MLFNVVHFYNSNNIHTNEAQTFSIILNKEVIVCPLVFKSTIVYQFFSFSSHFQKGFHNK